MKINCIVFGLSEQDTIPIVHEIKKRTHFDKIIWFGTVAEADINSHDFYNFKCDYDYTVNMPKECMDIIFEKLGAFFISSTRRNTISFDRERELIPVGETYGYLHHLWRYSYIIYNLIIKNNINFIVIDAVPHTSVDIILCQLAKYFNIPVLFLYQTNIPGKFAYFLNHEFKDDRYYIDFDIYFDNRRRPQNHASVNVTKEIKPPFYMTDFSYFQYNGKRIIGSIFPKLLPFLVRAKKLLRKIFPWGGDQVLNIANHCYEKLSYFMLLLKFMSTKNKLELEKTTLLMIKKIKFDLYQEALEKHTRRDISIEDVTYVYFPLCFQPEVTTEIFGHEWLDIVSAIEKTRAIIPKEWKIYVKEHPAQPEMARGHEFFERLASIPNLCFLPKEFSTYQLIQKSQFVALVNGTAGWEALQMGKKVLLFGDIYYKRLPGCFHYSSDFKFCDIMQYSVDMDLFYRELDHLCRRMDDGIVNGGYSALLPTFDEKKNAQYLSELIERKFLEFFSSLNQQSVGNYGN